jgi:UDP-N-acetylmuramate--alanine ligase
MNSRFEAVLNKKSLGIFEVPLIGIHNICNCLASIAVANELKVNMDIIREALRNFSGVQRRFELKGEISGIKVIDDYGHHPAEITATLRAVKEAIMQETCNRQGTQQGKGPGTDRGRLVVLFQPHRYSRTRDLLGDFIDAFADADKVVLMDIYPAGEKPLPGVDSNLLYRGIKDTGKDIEYIGNRDEIVGYLETEVKEKDTLLTLGAGDVWQMGDQYLRMKSEK